jgi:hypothetical protein
VNNLNSPLDSLSAAASSAQGLISFIDETCSAGGELPPKDQLSALALLVSDNLAAAVKAVHAESARNRLSVVSA